MSLDVEDFTDGVRFSIKAHPGSGRNSVQGVHDGCLKVYVTAAAEKGKANKAIIGVLARQLSIRKSNIEIISGQTFSRKVVVVHGIDSGELLKRLES